MTLTIHLEVETNKEISPVTMEGIKLATKQLQRVLAHNGAVTCHMDVDGEAVE